MDGWEPGYDERTRLMAASMLMFLVAVMCLLTVCAALSGCCTFCNRGDAFSELKRGTVFQASAAEAVYWPHAQRGAEHVE
jgi:hypothetical protein